MKRYLRNMAALGFILLPILMPLLVHPFHTRTPHEAPPYVVPRVVDQMIESTP